MNQSKFSLADVLTVLTALAFGFVSFLGVNFLNIGNDEVWGMPHITGCIVKAIVITVLLFGTAFGAKRLKRIKSNFKIGFILEIIFLVLFALFAVYFVTKTSPFFHYFTVTTQKSEITSKLQTSISQAENMFAEYENFADNRKRLYKNKLQAVANAKNSNPGEYRACFDAASNVSDVKQIETKMFILKVDLFPSNYSDTISNNGIKEVATNWLQHAKNITRSWKPIGIVGVVNDIEKNSNEWRSTLVTLYQVRQQCAPPPPVFDPDLTFEDVKTHFEKAGSPTPLSIGLAILAYALMLLAWAVTKRDTRFPGLKLLFGSGNSTNDEL